MLILAVTSMADAIRRVLCVAISLSFFKAICLKVSRKKNLTILTTIYHRNHNIQLLMYMALVMVWKATCMVIQMLEWLRA